MPFYHRVIWPKDVNGMADSVDADQTAPSDLGLHCLPDLSVQILWIITGSSSAYHSTLMTKYIHLHHLSHVTRKPVLGVCDQVRL